jgi:uncharacterized protein (TIGR00369 family)
MTQDAYFRTNFQLSIPDRIHAYLRSVTQPESYSGFETHPLQQVVFDSYSESRQELIYRLRVPASLCNKDGNLHGGAASTLLDNLSSTALLMIGAPGYWENMGVSRSLYVVFHRAVPSGSAVRVVCSVVAAGRKMATLRAELRTEQGALCVSCIHDKVGILNSKI